MKISYMVSCLSLSFMIISPAWADATKDAPPAPGAPVEKKTTPQQPPALTVPTKEEVPLLKARMKEIQEQLSVLKKEENQLRIAAREHFIAVESMTTNLNAIGDKDYIALRQEFQATQAKLSDLSQKLKRKMETMPEFKAANEKMTEIRNKMMEISEKSRTLIKERAQISGKLFQADPSFSGAPKPMVVKPVVATNAVAPASVPAEK